MRMGVVGRILMHFHPLPSAETNIEAENRPFISLPSIHFHVFMLVFGGVSPQSQSFYFQRKQNTEL